MHPSPPLPRRTPPADPGAPDAAVNSPARLQAVEKTGLLDTPAEQSFDALTRLATRITGATASFLSIVDGDRDFYKSQCGFPESLATARQLSGRTFCHYALDSDVPLIIDDTYSNPVWKTVPTVATLGVRSYAGFPIQVDGETIGSFCVIDVNQRDWQPEELETIQQLALSAGREIKLRAALTRASSDVRASIALARAREQVIAVVAHDLRTPLQVLHLSANLLQKTAIEPDQVILARMLRALDDMRSMAESLLASNAALAPSASGRLPVTTRTLLKDALDMMQPIAERAEIALKLGAVDAATIEIDYGQMLRVLGNLIGNALKYSPAGSTVLIEAKLANGFVNVTVQDNGKGMNPTEKSRAFESGYQGGAGMVLGEGAGLGLSIARTLVAEHGGFMELTSETGQGTTVTVSLPAK